jgi:hypothetical protein
MYGTVRPNDGIMSSGNFIRELDTIGLSTTVTVHIIQGTYDSRAFYKTF